MASLFDFLFDCLPIAVAHHGAHYATKEDRRTTIREGLRRANLGELRQQMMRLTTVRPRVLQGPGIDPERLQPRLWTLGIGNDLASVGRGTCIATGQNNDEMVVFERIQWGRELAGAVAPFVEVRTLDRALELPLTHEFLLDEWLIVASTHVPSTAIDMFPLETRPDFGLVRVFMYELDTETMEIVPLDPDAFDIRDGEAFDRYQKAAALLDSSIPGGGNLDAPVGEDLCAFEPFFSIEELEAIGGSIGIDEMVRFAVQRPRFLVATSIALTKENADLEPGAILGAAKFHPNILVSSSTTLMRIDAATRIERPGKTINLSRPGQCGCEQMHEEIRPLLVTDSNKSELLYPTQAAPPPYWGNIFSYYLVDPHVTHPGREWQMIQPQEGDRIATGYIERSGPAALTEVTSELTAKVPGQGDFDNIHIAPRMHLREATHIAREVLILQPPMPRRVRDWREIRATDMLNLDPIVMAPFCAHDCLHFHVRWGDHATARHVRGWARDPLLVAEVNRLGRNKLSQEMMTRCRARVTLPNAEPGASMYPPWHEVTMQVDSHSALLALSTVVPTLSGQREILFHAPWAYGVEFKRYHAFGVASMLAVGRTGQERFDLGRISSSGFGIDVIDPYDESAVFYWMLRYKSIVRPDGSYEAREYHFFRDLEKAISL